MQKNIHSKIGAAFILIITILMLSGCGNESRVAPDGTLIVDTSTVSVTLPTNAPLGVSCGGIVNGVGAVTSDFTIKVTTLDPNGDPAGKLDVQISVDFAENTSGGVATTAAFVTDIGSGTDTLITAGLPDPDPAPFSTTTDEFGELYIKLRLDTTYGEFCAYSGQVKISSGIHTAPVSFELKIATS